MNGYKPKRTQTAKSGGTRRSVERRSPPIDIFAAYKGDDRRIAEKLQACLDDDDFKGVQKVCAYITKAKDPGLRKDYVSALSWFGAEALPELTELMLDPDEDVASEATTQWMMALSEIDDCDRRMAVTFAAFGALTDEDALEFVEGELTGTALEYIDGEEDDKRQSEKRVEVVQALLDIIEGSVAVRSEFARNAYEDITGFRWIDVDEAELYLNAPDDYELPEDRVAAESPELTDESPAWEEVGEDTVTEVEDVEVDKEDDGAADVAEGKESAAQGEGDDAVDDSGDADAEDGVPEANEAAVDET